MQDQAERLREIMGQVSAPKTPERPVTRPSSCRVIAVTSGKGGVGKTNISVNLALAMANKGKNVLLFDADMGLANVDIMLGMMPQYTLLHVLNGQKNLSEIITEGPGGVKIVASGSGGVQELADLNEAQRAKFLGALQELQHQAEVILIDTGAGLHRNVLAFVMAAEEVVIVTTPEPTALMDAYGMIKILHREKRDPQIQVVVNMAGSPMEADEAGQKLSVLAKRFLDLRVEYLGFILRDPGMVRAVKEQRPVMISSPMGPSALSLNRLAESLLSGKVRPGEGNLLQFFKKVTQIFGGQD
ncbi:MAG TPA: MinD/ParA family protein [bacterium]|nr:MinD/ParA family protein [bacterium]